LRRGANRFHQVLIRRFGIPQFARPARATTRRCLAAHGRAIQGLNLQSYLFFGSANRLYQHVQGGCWRAIRSAAIWCSTSSWSTGNRFVRRLQLCPDQAQAAHDLGVRLMLVHLPAATEKALRSSGFISDDVS